MHTDDVSRQTSSPDGGIADHVRFTLRMVYSNFRGRPLLPTPFFRVNQLRPVEPNLRGCQNVLDELQLFDSEVSRRRNVENTDGGVSNDLPSYEVACDS